MNSVTIDGRTYTKEFVAQKLSTDPKWIERAIVRLYHRQTAHEQHSRSTNNTNGRGFNQSDAYMLSSFAVRIQKGYHLTEKQLAYALRPNINGTPRIAKYAGQILQVMAEVK